MSSSQISPSVLIFYTFRLYFNILYLGAVESIIRFLKDTFIILTHAEVKFLSKVCELIEIHRGKRKNYYVIKLRVHPDRLQTKQMDPGMHETSQTTRIDVALRASVGWFHDMHTCSLERFHIQWLDTKQKQLMFATDMNCQDQPLTSTDNHSNSSL